MKNITLLMISIIMFITSNIYSQGIIFNLSNGKKIEISSRMSSERMCYNDALKFCDSIGKGWRIPTTYELKEMFLNKDKIGGFVEQEKNHWAEGYKSAWYWTSTPGECYADNKCLLHMSIESLSSYPASVEDGPYGYGNWIRPVKDYNINSINNTQNNSQSSSITTTNSPATDRYGNKVSNNSTSVSKTTNATPPATTPSATKTTNTSKSSNVPVDSPWTLVGKTTSKLIKTGNGKYDLKYNSEFGSYIITKNLIRFKRVESNVDAHFLGNPMISTFIGAFAPKEELKKLEPQVPAIIEVCKSNDPDYEYVIVWANVKYGDFPYYNARGYIGERSVLGEITSIWFIP